MHILSRKMSPWMPYKDKNLEKLFLLYALKVIRCRYQTCQMSINSAEDVFVL